MATLPMTWFVNGPQGYESDKIRFEVLEYCTKGGLDLGCGPKKVWDTLIGVDSGKDTALFNVPMSPDVRVRDAAKLSIFADESMPCVFSSHLLEHIEDWQAALREWWRVVKVGGHLVLYLPHKDLYPNIGQPGANPDHKHDFDNAALVDFCRLAFPDWTLLRNEKREQGYEYSMLIVLRKEAAGAGQRDATQPGTVKRAGVVRLGGNGDALWSACIARELHAQGYEVTMYCGPQGATVLRHDPHIAHIIELPIGLLDDRELLQYWIIQAPKYDKWVNLIGSVEGRLLPHESQHEFYLPHAVRAQLMNRNYLDMVHDYAEIPRSREGQKFYPAAAEREFAQNMRAELPGKVVLLSPTGSGPFKAWPHAQRFMEIMAEHGVYTVMLGDLHHLSDLDMVSRDGIEYGHVVGQEWPLRAALAYAQLADAVVATESVFANAVAYEPMPKVVLLSHSSNENLTRDWTNTIALEARGVACHPCHRIHNIAAQFCTKDSATQAAACMASYGAELVADLVLQSLGMKPREARVIPIKQVA